MNRYISVSPGKTKQSFGKRPMEFAKRPKLPFAMRETRTRQKYLIEVSLLLGLWALGVVIGPFGTFLQLTFAERIVYWGFMSAVNWVQVRLVLYTLSQPGVLKYLNFWTLILAASAIASIPATFEVLWLEGNFRQHQMSFAECYVYVFLLTLTITGPVTRVFMWVELSGASPVTQVDKTTGSLARTSVGVLAEPPSVVTGKANTDLRECRFLERLPAALGQDVLCVGSEDHYVRVYTALGDDLILLRFSDAVAELAENTDLPGMQVHRSWWVADAGRQSVVRRDRKILLHLKNDLEVPVSRSYQKNVRGAGWI